MKKVYVSVTEDVHDRSPMQFIWNNKVYKVMQCDMCSLTESCDGKRAMPCKCRVQGQKNIVIIWMDGVDWFVEVND